MGADDDDIPEPPVTPIDMLLPGAWRSSRRGRHAAGGQEEEDDVEPKETAPPTVTPPVRPPLTLELPLTSLFGPDAEVDDPAGDPDPAGTTATDPAADPSPDQPSDPATPNTASDTDATPFWLRDVQYPRIRRPSPVLGRPAPAVAAAPPSVAVAEPPSVAVAVPPSVAVPEPHLVPHSEQDPAPAAGPPSAVETVLAALASGPRTAVRSGRRSASSPPRLRPTAILGGLGIVALLFGLMLPFALSALPFRGPDAVTLTAPTTTPSSGATAAAAPTSKLTGTPDTVVAAAATTLVHAPATPRVPRPATTSSSRTTTRPPTTKTKTRATEPASSASTRPGQVYVEPSLYIGRGYRTASDALRALGLQVRGQWTYVPDATYGSVVELRPSGWVRVGSRVQLFIAYA